MAQTPQVADRFLSALSAAVTEPQVTGVEVFESVARTAQSELGCSYVGLALLAPKGGGLAQVRHRGRIQGERDPEELLRQRLRVLGRQPDAGRFDQTDGDSAWSVWPLRRGAALRGAMAAQWPGRFGGATAPLPGPGFDAVFALAASVITRILGFEELRHAQAELLDENEYLREEIRVRYRPENMVWTSGAMEELTQAALRVAASTATVLIHGETGTGKEVLAHLIHEHSPRANRPFIRVNCGALPDSLLESELFGHVRGAFTGATTDRKGRFEAADGGTIFLDEIGDVGPKLQVRLLRVLQEREIERVGDHVPRRIDVRVVAATHRDLEAEVTAGRFREDLYYRLNVVYLHIPPLRERPADILPLAEHFLDRYNRENFKQVRLALADVIALLERHHWPGNVRELQNCMEKAVVLAPGDELTVDLLPTAIAAGTARGARAEAGPGGAAPASGSVEAAVSAFARQALAAGDGAAGQVYRELMAQVERPLLAAALAAAEGNQLLASRRLGINRNTLRAKLRRYGLHPRDGTP